MLDPAYIREHPDAVRRGARRKGIAFDVDRLLALDEERRRLTRLQEEARAEQKALGRQVATLAGPSRAQVLEHLAGLKARVQAHTEDLERVTTELDALLLACPNPPDEDAPDGPDEGANVELRRWGEVRDLGFAARDHVELMTGLGMLEVERAGRLAGSRSYVLKGPGALLEQAVLRLAQDVIVARGFVLLSVPVLVKEWTLRGTAYFPGAEERFCL